MAKKPTAGLTHFSLKRPKPKRGPKTIHQQTLINRRDSLVQLLEWYWGEIGWSLLQANTSKDIGRAFEFLYGRRNDETINLLCRPSAESASKEELRRVRRQIAALVSRGYAEYQRSQVAQERLVQAEAAFAQAQKSNRAVLKSELLRRKEQASTVAALYQGLNRAQQQLQEQLRLMENAFARHEILRFIGSKRYELNPLNLANAVAGLPFMSWRQSMKRCRWTKPVAVNTAAYRAFKAIRYLLSTVLAYDEASLEKHFSDEIPRLPKRHAQARRVGTVGHGCYTRAKE